MSHSAASSATPLPPPPVSEVLASPEPLGLTAVQLESGVPAALPSPVWYYLRGVLSGTASGVTKLVVGHPFDTIKGERRQHNALQLPPTHYGNEA